MFDGDELKYWVDDVDDQIEEIDLNEFINWDEVNNKALEAMKENSPKGTIFVDVDKDET